MIVKNREALATTKLRKEALDIIEAGIRRILPINTMTSLVKYDRESKIISIEGDKYNGSSGRIFVVGGGKASGLMAESLEAIVPIEDIEAGIVNCKGGHYKTRKIKVNIAGHPIPDKRGLSGVRDILALKSHYLIDKDDLVICLISGGASALMPYPVSTITLKDIQVVTELLINSGAEINEINIVRKHLSQVKGGRLGSYFYPATVVSLVLSDVIGNDLSVIASGPTYPDPSTFLDAYDLLQRYNLLNEVPKSVTDFLKRGCLGKVAETPKTLSNCHNYIIGDNKLALKAMQERAEMLGRIPYIVTTEQKGDTVMVARMRANEIINSTYAGYNLIMIGGETTLKIPTTAGKGGRNQHYAAISMVVMEKYMGDWVLVSICTDGSDFLPDVAGAIVDHNSVKCARDRGIDVKAYLDRYDSNTLLNDIGGSLIITGDTGTNVGDLILYLTK